MLQTSRCLFAGLLLIFAAVAQVPNDKLPVWTGDASTVATRAGRRVFLTPDRGTLVLVLREGEPPELARVPLFNHMSPAIHATVDRLSYDRYRYHYRIANLEDSIDAVGLWSVVVPAEAHAEPKHLAPEGQRWGTWAAKAPIARSIIGGPPGRLVSWLATERPNGRRPIIPPGESVAGFELTSDFKPGFCTAYFAHWKPVSVDPDWPEEIQREAAPFLDSFLDRRPSRLTIGPLFRDDASREDIVENLLKGIELWIDEGHLAGDSPFVTGLLVTLENGSPLLARPDTDAEKELESAFLLSGAGKS